MIIKILLLLAVIALLVYLLLSFFFPEKLFLWVRLLLRRACGLSLRTIDVEGVVWHYLEGGPPTGDVLVLLHGFGGDKDNWPFYARYFARRYRLIIPDLPGFGDSSRRATADYTIAAQTERLHRFIRALELERAHIAGNSMGGYLALNFALHYPDTVLTIGLLDNAGVIGKNESELELAVARNESPLTVRSMAEFRDLIALIMHRRLPVPGFVRRAMCATAVDRHDFLYAVFQSLTDEIRARPLNDQLERVTVPTLILWGRQDKVIDVSCAELMAAEIPTNRCVVLEETGHIPMIERPAQAAAAHLDFLDAHETA